MSNETVGWDTEFEAGMLDDYDATITASHFAPDAQYANGEVTILQWTVKTDNPDVPETHLWFPTGKGWSSKNGGKSIVHDSEKPGKFFVKNSLMAKLISRCVNDFGIQELLAGRGGPLESGVWLGLKFHIKREDIEFGGNFTPINKEFPQRFLGVAGDDSVAASAPVTTDSGVTTEAPAGESAKDKMLRLQAERQSAANAANANGGGGGGLKDTVLALAKQHDSFGSFQDAALQIEGVSDDNAIIEGLIDESGLYAEGRA